MSREGEGWDGGALAILLGSEPEPVTESEEPVEVMVTRTGFDTGRVGFPKLDAYRHIVPSPWKAESDARTIRTKYGSYLANDRDDYFALAASILVALGSGDDDF